MLVNLFLVTFPWSYSHYWATKCQHSTLFLTLRHYNLCTLGSQNDMSHITQTSSLTSDASLNSNLALSLLWSLCTWFYFFLNTLKNEHKIWKSTSDIAIICCMYRKFIMQLTLLGLRVGIIGKSFIYGFYQSLQISTKNVESNQQKFLWCISESITYHHKVRGNVGIF